MYIIYIIQTHRRRMVLSYIFLKKTTILAPPAAGGESTISNLHESKRELYMSLLDSPTFVLEEVGATPGEYVSNVNETVSQVVKGYFV